MLKKFLVLFLTFTIVCTTCISATESLNISESYIDRIIENFDAAPGTLLSDIGWYADSELSETLLSDYKIAENGGFEKTGLVNMYRSTGEAVNISSGNDYWFTYDFSFNGVDDFSGFSLGNKYKMGVDKKDGKVFPVIYQDPNGNETELLTIDEFEPENVMYKWSDNVYTKRDTEGDGDLTKLHRLAFGDGYAIYEIDNPTSVRMQVQQSPAVVVFPRIEVSSDFSTWTNVPSSGDPTRGSEWQSYNIEMPSIPLGAKYLKVILPEAVDNNGTPTNYWNNRVERLEITSAITQAPIDEKWGTTELTDGTDYTALVHIRPSDDTVSLMVYESAQGIKAEWDIETEDVVNESNLTSMGVEGNTTGGFKLTRLLKEEVVADGDVSKAYCGAQYNAKLNDIKSETVNADNATTVYDKASALEIEISAEVLLSGTLKQELLGELANFKSNILDAYQILMGREKEEFDAAAGTLLSSTGWYADSELSETLSANYKIAENGGFEKTGLVEMYRTTGEPINTSNGNEYWFRYDFSFNGVNDFSGLVLGNRYKMGVDKKDGKVFPVIYQDPNTDATERITVDEFRVGNEMHKYSDNAANSIVDGGNEVLMRSGAGSGYVIYEIENPTSVKIRVTQSPAVAVFPSVEISDDLTSWSPVASTGDPVRGNSWQTYEVLVPNIPIGAKYLKVILPDALDDEGNPTQVWNNRIEDLEITSAITRVPIAEEWGETELTEGTDYTALVRVRPSNDTVSLMIYETVGEPDAMWDIHTKDLTFSKNISSMGFVADTTSGFRLDEISKEQILETSMSNLNTAFDTMLKTKYYPDIETAQAEIDAFYDSIAKSYMESVANAYYTENGSIVPVVEYVSISGTTTLTATASVLDAAKNLKELIYKWYYGNQLIGTGATFNASGYIGKTISVEVIPYNRVDIMGVSKTATATVTGTVIGGSYPTGGGGTPIVKPPVEDEEEETLTEGGAFTDVNGHWAEKEISQMAKKGIVNGVGNNKFDPEASVTRAECAAMILRFINPEKPNTNYSGMNDVPYGAWYYDSVNAIVNMGLMSGYEAGFNPEKPITREELAKVMAGVYKYMGNSALSASDVTFTDTGEISDWALPYIKECIKAGLMNGMEDGSFTPQGNTTRAQMAVVLSRLVNVGSKF